MPWAPDEAVRGFDDTVAPLNRTLLGPPLRGRPPRSLMGSAACKQQIAQRCRAAASADGRCPRCAARPDRRKADPAKQPSSGDARQDGLGLATRTPCRDDDSDRNRAGAGSRQRRSGRPMPRVPGLIATHGRGDADTGEDVSWQTPLRGHTSQHNDYHATEPEPDRLGHEARLQRCASVRAVLTSPSAVAN